MSEFVAERTSEQDVIRQALQHLRRISSVSVAFGGLVRDRTLQLTELDGTRTTALKGLVIRCGAGLGGRVMSTARPHGVRDYLLDAQISHDYDVQVRLEGLRSVVAVPVLVERSVAGVLYAAVREPLPIGDRIAEIAVGVAAKAGQDLRVDNEVRRRLAVAERHQAAARHERPGTIELECIREAHAELRAMATTVSDFQLRRRLDQVTRLLAGAFAGEHPSRAAVTLSAREVDVLAQVAQGCTNSEVADRLGLRPETVKSYLRSAARKLQAHTRHEAVVAARREGLLP